MTPLSEPVAMSLAPLPGNDCLLSIPREAGPARRFFSEILVGPFYSARWPGGDSLWAGCGAGSFGGAEVEMLMRFDEGPDRHAESPLRAWLDGDGQPGLAEVREARGGAEHGRLAAVGKYE